MNEAATLRSRIRDDRDGSDPGEDVRSGTRSILCKTVVVTAYPTSASASYGLQRVRQTGAEVEGAAVATVDVGKPFTGPNVGGSIPPVGTLVRCTLLGGKWTFDYG